MDDWLSIVRALPTAFSAGCSRSFACARSAAGITNTQTTEASRLLPIPMPNSTNWPFRLRNREPLLAQIQKEESGLRPPSRRHGAIGKRGAFHLSRREGSGRHDGHRSPNSWLRGVADLP